MNFTKNAADSFNDTPRSEKNPISCGQLIVWLKDRKMRGKTLFLAKHYMFRAKIYPKNKHFIRIIFVHPWQIAYLVYRLIVYEINDVGAIFGVV